MTDEQMKLEAAVLALRQEIAVRRKAEEALAASEREQRELAQMLELERAQLVAAQSVAKVGSWETDLLTMKVRWSEQVYQIFGVARSADGPSHEEFLRFVHPDDRNRVDEAFVESIRVLVPRSIEHRLLLADGRTKHVEERWQVYTDGAGVPVRVMGTCQDITERKQAEQERDRLFNLSGDLLCVAGFDGRLEQVNPAWTHCLGWSAGELTGRPSVDFVHPDDREATLNARGALKQGSAIRIENRYRCKDGSFRWLSWSSHPLPETRQVFAVARDITAGKQSELELARSNRALRMLSSCCESLTRISDEKQLLEDICHLAVETGGYRMAWVGYTADDEERSIIPMALAGEDSGYLSEIRLTWDENDPISRGPAGRTIRSGQAVVCDDITSDAEFFHWQELASERGYRSVICLPLHDRERTFGLLALYSGEISQTGSDELKLLHELADDLAFGIVNIRSQVERRRMQAAVTKVAASVSASASGQFFVQLASNMAEALGAHAGFISRIAPGQPSAARTIAAVVAGMPVGNCDYQIGGTPFEALVEAGDCIIPCAVTDIFPELPRLCELGAEAYAGRRLVDSNGQVVGLLFVLFQHALRDTDFITSTLQIFATRAAAELERQKADALLREQASLLDKAQDAILVCGLDHRILYWNRSAQRLYGWTSEEALGASVNDLIYQDVAGFLAAKQAALESGEWVGEIRQLTKSGQQLVVEGHWSLVHDDEGLPKSILAINTDITERRNLEQQFLRAQRMESIGTLAGGIAHDLNNMLSPIMMSIDLLRNYVVQPKGHEILNLIDASARRGAEMVSQVLSFARGFEGQMVDVRVSHIIRDLVRIMVETFPKNIRIKSVIGPELWHVKGDPTRIHQVLLNLCVNARDAMPDGGEIIIRAENVVIDSADASMIIEASPGLYLKIEVVDSGHGIPGDIIDRLFDPFFTTKEVGKGTGLGLSTSLAIIKSHGGFIRASSEPGSWARFDIHLPAFADTAPAPVEDEKAKLPRGKGETILLVDDEESIRQLVRQILETFGYRVITASDGAEALAIFKVRKDKIDLVLTDMMMPVMDGPETIRNLVKVDPHVRIIAASGLAAEGQLSRDSRAGIRHFLSKPYSAETLLSALRHELDEKMC